jgi:hypothetical protein
MAGMAGLGGQKPSTAGGFAFGQASALGGIGGT